MTTQIPITLNGRPYVADLAEYRRRTLPIRREAIDQSTTPGDQSLTTEGEWRRRMTRFDGGMFQFQQDAEGSDLGRPRSSFNMGRGKDNGPYCTMPMWLPRDEVTTGETVNIRPRRTDRGLGLVAYAKVNGGNFDLVVVEANGNVTVRYSAVASVKCVALDPHDDNLTVGNANIFHATQSNVYKNNAVFAAFGAVDLFLFRDHFFAMRGSVKGQVTGIREMSRTGTFSGAGQLDFTIPTGDSYWNVIDMYAVHDGYLMLVNRGMVLGSIICELLFIGIDGDGLLVDPILVDRMPAWAWGFGMDEETFLIADSHGYRFGVYIGDGNVEMGPWFGVGDDLSQRFDTQQNDPIKLGQIDAHRGRFYVIHPAGYQYGVASHDWFANPRHGQVLVVDATRFVAPLVPAIAESFGPASTGTPSTVTYLICTAAAASATGVEDDATDEFVMLFRSGTSIDTWRRCTNDAASTFLAAAASAAIQTGLLSFGIAEKKVITRVAIRLSDVIPNHAWTIVVKALSYDASTGTETYTTLDTLTNGDGPLVEIAIGGAPVDAFGLLLEWDFDSASAGSSMVGVEEITVYALPVPNRTEEWQIPILLSEQVAVPGDPQGSVYTYDTKVEFETIKALERNATPVTFVEGGNTYTVIVDQVQVEPRSWNSQLSFFEGVVRLRLLSTGET